jgi:putative restriction endonuclease
MRYWWVNQNQTYAHEVRGGYLWSPKTNANGARNRFYDNMKDVEPGDVIFSFSDTLIKAIGIATEAAVTSPKPDEFGTKGGNWAPEGWMVLVQYTELERPIKPKTHIADIRPALPPKYSPLQVNGNGNQGVYLAAVPTGMAAVLGRLLSGQLDSIVAKSSWITGETLDNEEEAKLSGRGDIGPTEKLQLIKARRGQGLFRSRVESTEVGCRVTGVTARAHLRASHIKPWRDSNDTEKLDGSNGLLLAPHVDHLFDNGFISFDEDGTVMVSPVLAGEIVDSWGLPFPMNAGTFTPRQKTYLMYHRANVFQGGT